MTLSYDILYFSSLTLLSAIFLWLTSKILKLENNKFKIAFIAAFLLWVISFSLDILFQTLNLYGLIYTVLRIILITFLLSWIVLKGAYSITYSKAFLVWLVWKIGFFMIILLFTLILSLLGISILSSLLRLS